MKIKKITLALFVSLFALIALVYAMRIGLCLSNYKHNCKLWDDNNGIIYNQHNEELKDMRAGVRHAEYNSCGAVAIYNLLELEGKHAYLPDIIKYMDINGEFLFGALGMRPTRVISFLKEQGYQVKMHNDTSKFEELSKNSKYSILAYCNLKETTGHFLLYTTESISERTYITTYNASGYKSFNYIKNIIIPNNTFTFLITVN